jgi:4-diphosphocytidyl-2-C-methyl-D-erythritol kinase
MYNEGMELLLKSPAKINLLLKVIGKENRYHRIVTVMHTVDLFDTVVIKPDRELKVRMAGAFAGHVTGENIIHKTCRLFQKVTGIEPKVAVEVEKRIPVGGGLGGGSSNSATVLKALNRIYGEPLKEEELFEVAGLLGSDVPFFLKGGLAVAYGRGERLRFFKPARFNALLVFPGFPCSTAQVYRELGLAESDFSVEDAERLIVKPLLQGNLKEVERNMVNDLELSKAPCVRRVATVKEELKRLGIKALMTGSGSCVFSIITSFPIQPLKENNLWFRFVSSFPK